ncbi:MAG: PH domain-containing protein [bacterium]|nr:PH domain-containing protein [bacterium]
MALTIIFVVSIGIVLPIMYFVMRFEGKPKENMLFGVTMKKAYYNDSRVEQLQKRYKRELNWCSLLLLLVLIPIVMIKYFSIVYTLTMAWLFLMILLTILPFIRANGELKRIKKENGWHIGGQEEKKAEYEMIRLSDPIEGKLYFIASIISSVLTMAVFVYLWAARKVALDFAITAIGLSLISVCLAAIGVLFQRRKIKLLLGYEQFERQAEREKNLNWGRSLGCLSWINQIYTIGLLIILYQKKINLILLMILSIVYMILAVWLLLAAGINTKRKAQELYSAEGLGKLEEEDQHWIFGMIYYNKEDKSTFVDTRIGSGYSFNMARRSSKIIMIFVALCLLLLPISSIFMIADEFTPIDLYMTESSLKVKRYKVDYSIEKNEITDIQLLEKLPDLRKTNGTSMDNLKKGNFSCEEYGAVKACLAPKNSCFLLIATKDYTYIVSDDNDDDTRKIYKEINE